MNNFGIWEAFLAAGLFNKFLLALLLVVSIYSWSVIVAKFLLFRKHLNILNEINLLVDKNTMRLENYINSNSNVYSEVIQLILKHNKIPTDSKDEDFNVQVDLITKSSMVMLENKISNLATIANVSPFLGLLGTVVGVISSFVKIGVSSSASLAVIAPGIAEALYATAFGLFIAIPATVFYNYFINKIDEYKDKRDFLFNKIYYLDKKD